MHSNLYAQTGHFATPKEMGALMILVVLIVLATLAKSVFS